MAFELSHLHLKTLALLKRSDRWSEKGRMNGLVNVVGMVRGKMTHEYLDEGALRELLAADLVECDKSQRLHDKNAIEGYPNVRWEWEYLKIRETDVRYWNLTDRGREVLEA